MEITNEIKAKVMMQYWGQDLSIPGYLGYELDGISEMSVKAFGRNNGMYELFKLESCKLILKPLSSITDEDMRGCLRLELGKNRVINVSLFEDKIIYQKKLKYSYANCVLRLGIEYLAYGIYQFLVSKGYDLPQYLLGGATLKEAGLAIYE